MSKKVRSAKGEMVDFDVLRLKEQIACSPVTQKVQARQDFIERRLRRRVKRTPTPSTPIKASTEDLNVQPIRHEQAKPTSKQRSRPTRKKETK